MSPSDKVGNCIYDVNVTCNNIKTIVLFVWFDELLYNYLFNWLIEAESCIIDLD